MLSVPASSSGAPVARLDRGTSVDL